MMFVYQFQPNNFIDYIISEIFDNIIKTNNINYKSNNEIDIKNLGYSDGLKLYIHETNNEYFIKNKKPLFDILAGLFGVAITIRPEKFYESLNKVNKNISVIENKNPYYKYELRRCFDEILLLELFKDLYTFKLYGEYSMKINILSNDEIANIMFILNNFQYPHKQFEFNTTDIIQKTIFGIMFDNKEDLIKKYFRLYRSNKYEVDANIISVIDMYIVDYNIEYFIDNIFNKAEETNCIEINVNNINISSILNLLIIRNKYNSYDLYFPIKIQNLYNNKYDFSSFISLFEHSLDKKQKYLKYKMKYLKLKYK
jgi:hypothetical protein